MSLHWDVVSLHLSSHKSPSADSDSGSMMSLDKGRITGSSLRGRPHSASSEPVRNTLVLAQSMLETKRPALKRLRGENKCKTIKDIKDLYQILENQSHYLLTPGY